MAARTLSVVDLRRSPATTCQAGVNVLKTSLTRDVGCPRARSIFVVIRKRSRASQLHAFPQGWHSPMLQQRPPGQSQVPELTSSQLPPPLHRRM